MNGQYKDILNLIELKQYAKAKNFLKKLLEKNKEDFYIYQLLGVIYYNTGNIDKSIKYYNLSLNIKSENAGVLLNLGIIYRSLNDLMKAKKFILKSIEVDPNFLNSYLNMTNIYEIEKNYVKANEYYQKAFSVKQNHPDLIRAYSNFLVKIGETTKAMSIIYKNFGNIRFGKSNLEII
jgi:Tfp pilus assembly protein PilF